MSVASRPAARRRPALRLLPLEDRTVPTTTAVGTNFAGGSGNNFAPPDTDGSVGPNDYVQFINGRFAVYSKAGAQRLAEADDAFWNAAGISSGITDQGVSDPRVVYDPLADRWFASEINTPSLGNTVVVGRSDTNDPAGTWHATSYLAVDNGTFGDYDTLGVDANGVYIGTVNFSATDEVGSTLTSIPKADLLLSTPSVARRTTVTDPTFSLGEILQGVNNATPNPAHASVVSADRSLGGVVDRTTLTGTGGGGAQFGPTSGLSAQSTSQPSQAHQPDGTQQIDTIDYRFGSRVWQVGDLIVGAHCIHVGARDAVRVTVVSDSQNAVVAEATISDSTYDYIFPSVAMNRYGDMLIGFTRAGGSGSTNGNLGAYARYAFIDPANPTTITVDSTSIPLRTGAANNYHLFGGSFERWGDYSATDVDPTDPTSFWTTQEYAAAGGFNSTWGTQVSQVAVSPRVLGVTSTAANGTYGVGAVIPVTVTFNAKVTVTGTPQLALNAGAGALATYAGGSGTATLTFNYTVGVGQTAADLNYADAASLALNGGTIKRTGAANPDANLTLPDPAGPNSLGGSMNIRIDTRPRVTGGVSSPLPDGTYGADAVIPITVTFSSPVDVTGTPQLALKLTAGPAAVATYAGGTGTATLTFDYTVLVGQMAADLDYASATALTLPAGATIKDHTGGADAALTLPAPGAAGSLGANKNIVIDTSSPKVADVNSPTPDGTYGFGQTVQVVVTFNKPADVTGVPELALNAGPGAKATYVGGTGTAALTFAYTVGLADQVADLNYTSTAALTLPAGATIKEQGSAVDATLTLPATTAANSLGGHKNIAVDGTPGRPLDVTSATPDGRYEFNAVVPLTVTFTKPVVVDTTGGTPTLALNSGGTATYTGGPGTFTALSFAYTVGLGDFAPDLDALGAGALALNGAAVTDLASGAPAPLAVPVGADPHSLASHKNLDIDGRPGQPFDVTSSLPNGAYPAGTVVPLTVTFTKPVVVDTTGGTPALALNSGGTATYTGTSGTLTQLPFTYTVQPGDQAADLDALGAGALALNGAAVTDLASGTPAPLAVPVGADPHSLATNKNLVVDTTAATVVEFRALFGSRWYNLAGASRIDLPWKVTAIQVVFDEPVTAGTVRSLAGLPTRRLTGLRTDTLTWRLATPLTRGSFAAALVTAGADALKDSAGNPTNPFNQAFTVLYGDVNGDHVVDALDEAGVRSFQAAPYQPGSAGYNLFADLSGDGIVNLIDVGIARSRKGTHL